MVATKEPNAFVRLARPLYNNLGFTKGYAFTLYVILGGALLGFTLARLQYLAYDTTFCPTSPDDQQAAPGECFYFSTSRYKIGLLVHLGAIFPASILVIFQFLPIIRHKFLLYHRLAGYVILMLSVVSSAGVLMIARRSFGGGLEIQGLVGVLTLMFLGSLGMALWNIRKKQVEKHRAWMLRAWVYAGSIITSRIVLILCTIIITKAGSYHIAKPCAQVEYTIDDETDFANDFPGCLDYISGKDPGQWTTVKADFNGNAAEMMAVFDLSFGIAVWIALAIHAVGVEIYLHLYTR